jgi:hypothetical protein
MKTNQTAGNEENAGGRRTFRGACASSRQRVPGQISKAREAILAEARDTLSVQDRLLRLALNEAEALAWQTLYPHLVFPTLATEKIQRVAAWNHRQRRVAGLSRSLN